MRLNMTESPSFPQMVNTANNQLEVVKLHRTYYLFTGSMSKRTNIVKYKELPQHVVPYEECNLIGSLVDGFPELHLPMFDVDEPFSLEWLGAALPGAKWLPSRTPGHWHAYLQAAMPWDACAAMLQWYSDHQLIDRVWAGACLDQKQMFLRKPITRSFIP